MSTPTGDSTSSGADASPSNKEPLASDPGTSSTPPGESSTSSIRPEQKAFTRPQREHLMKHMPEYATYVAGLQGKGPRRLAGVKGCKSQWVMDNVYQGYVQEFKCEEEGGPNLASLQKAMIKFFSNNVKSSGDKVSDQTLLSFTSSSKPRATNAVELFAAENSEAIKQKITSDRIELGLTPRQGNLKFWHKHKNQLYSELDEEAHIKYERMAAEHNARLAEPPSREAVFAKQETLLATVAATLQRTCGWGHEGHGDVAFFVQGAYRNEQDDVKMFNNAAKTERFSDACSNFKDYRKQFRRFFEKTFPVTPAGASASKSGSAPDPLTISFNEDGLPLLPPDEPDSIAAKNARVLLTGYFEAMWKHSNTGAMPWDVLATSDRSSIGLVHEALAAYPSLHIDQMKSSEVLQLYGLIFEAQGRSEYIIKFSAETHDDDDDDDIIEIDAVEPSQAVPPPSPVVGSDILPQDPSVSAAPTLDFTSPMLQELGFTIPSSNPEPDSINAVAGGSTSGADDHSEAGSIVDTNKHSEARGRGRGSSRGRARGRGRGRGGRAGQPAEDGTPASLTPLGLSVVGAAAAAGSATGTVPTTNTTQITATHPPPIVTPVAIPHPEHAVGSPSAQSGAAKVAGRLGEASHAVASSNPVVSAAAVPTPASVPAPIPGTSQMPPLANTATVHTGTSAPVATSAVPSAVEPRRSTRKRKLAEADEEKSTRPVQKRKARERWEYVVDDEV
ncbi:hypothetical protein LshimejAT787_0600750 [Lyophyllum shimeji]|uniref:Uncharacterized protein n=1 Tax=Lyophyllum shimeji TaxID=47721 RepID=A0A9P3PNY7_LYOSH|nr:hypothetical protein LshimejAT787_0600750 [Lyophyllum shimeji]